MLLLLHELVLVQVLVLVLLHELVLVLLPVSGAISDAGAGSSANGASAGGSGSSACEVPQH